MEYRLNKIDTDLRQKINDAAKDGMVHGAKSIAINKDNPKGKNGNGKDKSEQKNKNKRLLVNAVKIKKIEIEAFKKRSDDDSISKGLYLDIKK